MISDSAINTKRCLVKRLLAGACALWFRRQFHLLIPLCLKRTYACVQPVTNRCQTEGRLSCHTLREILRLLDRRVPAQLWAWVNRWWAQPSCLLRVGQRR